jgi:hypothetical protein
MRLPKRATKRRSKRSAGRSERATERPADGGDADDEGERSQPAEAERSGEGEGSRSGEAGPSRRRSRRDRERAESGPRQRERSRSRPRGDDGAGNGPPGGREGRGRSVASELAAIGVALLRGLAALAGAALGALRGPAVRLRRRLETVGAAAARVLTPARALLITAIGCAVLLGLSQFADYRGVAIGAGAYSGIESVAPAPVVEREELGTAHGYALLPAALIAIAALLLAARSRRWRLCRLAVAVGVAAVVVAIGIDRPTGLDEGAVARDFADAEAKLLGGFWTQLFAGIGLVLTSLLLAAEMRRGGPARSSSRARRPKGREMSVATAARRAGAGSAEV